jgi:hypothetical protein
MKKKLLLIVLLWATSTSLLTSCKKGKEPEPTPTPTTTNTSNTGAPTITSSFYFQAKIDGTWITYQEGGYTGSGTGSNGGSVPAGWQEDQNALIYNFTTGQSASFSILKTFPSTPTTAQIDAMFGIRSYSYGKRSPSTAANGIDGCVVTYTDASGTIWSTDYGTGNQTGSTFNIVEHITNTDGNSPKISKATFSCKLYDENGHTKTLTNGIYRGRTIHY